MANKECSRLDEPDVLKILFHPRRDFSRNDDGRDVSYQVADEIEIGGRFHPAEKDAPVILLFHGNGEIASDYDMIAPLYNEIGISLLVADYRGYGRSGGKPTASTLLSDSVSVYQQTRQGLADHGYKPAHLFIMGRSLGSAPAIEIAATAGNSIAGLIIESGFSDSMALIERLGGPSLGQLIEETCGFNNAGKMQKITVPTLIIHGEDDYIIPVEEGKRLFQECGAKKKRFLGIPRAGHNDLLLRGRREYFEAVRKLVLG